MAHPAGSPSGWSAAPLALTMGDPAGVGPQITVKAWLERARLKAPFVLFAPPHQVDQAIRRLGADCQTVVVTDPREAGEVFQTRLPIIAIDGDVVETGSPSANAAGAIIASIDLAVAETFSGRCSAVVTNPINKALLYSAGFGFPGHTEYLAELARRASGAATAPRPVMMLVGGGLRVALATIHVPLSAVPGLLQADLIEEVARIVETGLRTDFGFTQPRIALAGLNPHAGEDGSLGREEIDVINPVAAKLRSAGLEVSNARPGDTVFHEMLEGVHDAVIAMYHDQGLAPLKTVAMWDGVNTTLGLPFIRTSPDHGTAYDAARTGTARPDSLVAALNLAADMVASRTRRSA